MSHATAVIAGQVVTLAAQLGYVFAFHAAFERQSDTLRSRPLACLGWGFALAAFWTLLGLGAFHLAAANQNPWILTLMSVPMFLASAAGGAVCLGIVAARALRWDLRQRPYLSVTIGQTAAVAVGQLPFLGVALVALYACAGIGALIVSEFSASREAPGVPRLGTAGLACLVALTAAISFGLVRGGRRMSREARPLAPPPAVSAPGAAVAR